MAKRFIGYSDQFEAFWAIYPRKEGKGAAWNAWEKLAPDSSLQDQMLLSVETYKRSRQWLKNGGEFIPHASTWINQRRFDDDVASRRPMLSDTATYNLAASEEAQRLIEEADRRRHGHRR